MRDISIRSRNGKRFFKDRSAGYRCYTCAKPHRTRNTFFRLAEGFWRTPLGDTSIDEELVNEILNRCELLEKDKAAHTNEHSAEVILPFLQYSNPQVKIVVIVVRSGNLRI